MPVLFLLFVAMPIIEISLLIQVGGAIGGWNTIAIVIVTAFLGAHFVRREGLSTLQSAQRKMQQNQLPGNEMIDGLMLVVAGVLLVTPGFITDIFGFLLVLPGSRHLIRRYVVNHMKVRVVTASNQSFYSQSSPRDPFSHNASKEHGDIIDGEYADKTDDNDNHPRLK